MYYSPGVDYLCPRCNSNGVRFIFEGKCKGWFETMKMIRAKKIKLSDSYFDYKVRCSKMDLPKLS